jgi:hypothetical protein
VESRDAVYDGQSVTGQWETGHHVTCECVRQHFQVGSALAWRRCLGLDSRVIWPLRRAVAEDLSSGTPPSGLAHQLA